MEFIPLHDVPTFQTECAEVLNEEWKRSLTARLHSVEKSRDKFPICLVLLETDAAGERIVVGHSRLSVVLAQELRSCFLESVVVRKSHRGKGYGRVVMQKTEEFASSKGYQVVYLITDDKQKFYEHLGYEYCSPVMAVSSDILPEQLADKLSCSLGGNCQDNKNPLQTSKKSGLETRQKSDTSSGCGQHCKSKSLTCDTVDVHGGESDSVSDEKINPITEGNLSPSEATTVKDTACGTSDQNQSASYVTPPHAPLAPPPPPLVKPATREGMCCSNLSLISWMKKKIA